MAFPGLLLENQIFPIESEEEILGKLNVSFAIIVRDLRAESLLNVGLKNSTCHFLKNSTCHFFGYNGEKGGDINKK
ncbi:hypothetical protein ES705_02209 [subsurface metagenome]